MKSGSGHREQPGSAVSGRSVNGMTTGTPAGANRRIVIIGAVAAGTSAAAKARRNDENVEIVLYEKDRHISYSGCGLPYYIGGTVAELSTLVPRDPAFFRSK